MTRKTKKQIIAAVRILRGIPIARILRDTYACLGCGAKYQVDCADGCWASEVEQSADRLAELAGVRRG